KLGSMSTFKSVNCTRNEACPIQVTATWPLLSLGKLGRRCSPVRGVSKAFQTISRKKMRGLKCLAGVKSLKRRGSGWRAVAGRYGTGLIILCSYCCSFCAANKLKSMDELEK